MRFIKIILILFTICCNFKFTISADEPSSEPIKLIPIGKEKPVTKPQAPSRVQLQAYYNGTGITITSTVAIQTEVIIYDNLSGEQYFNGAATLAPSFFCEIPDNATSVSIIIKTSNAEYHGTLYK